MSSRERLVLSLQSLLLKLRAQCAQKTREGGVEMEDILCTQEPQKLINILLSECGFDTGEKFMIRRKLVTSVISTQNFSPIKDHTKRHVLLVLYDTGRVRVVKDTMYDLPKETHRGSLLDATIKDGNVMLSWVDEQFLSAFERLGAEGIGID